MAKCTWKLPDEQTREQALRLAGEMRVPELLAAVLVNRGVTTPGGAEAFLSPDRSRLHEPSLLPDMEPALGRLHAAIERGERIFVCGDYDVDGITSVVLVKRCLAAAGVDIGCFIPNRLTDGYGLSEKGITAAKRDGAQLIVTVDSGVTGHDQIRLAGELGIDVIVTDHHEPQDSLPDAVAVVDPKRKDSEYPYKDLAGVGVAFKLMEGLAREIKQIAHAVEENLDLVAVGTVADIVPLTCENRILTAHGLARLRNTSNVGLTALMDVARVDPWTIEASGIGYALGPRLNAAGRLGDAGIGVKLLTTDDPSEAERIARDLDRQNRKRRTLESLAYDSAAGMMRDYHDLEQRHSIVLWSDDWHPGVIGIVASRLARRYHRPTILVALDGGRGKGSGRSILGFDLHGALARCRETLESFGGHRYAAGLSVKESDLVAFSREFEQVAADGLSPEDLVPVIDVDAIISLDQCNSDLVDLLRKVGPFGSGNPEPVFGTRDLRVISAKEVGKGHLKATFSERDLVMDGIGFGMASLLPDLRAGTGRVAVAYLLKENSWKGVTDLELELRDVQIE